MVEADGSGGQRRVLYGRRSAGRLRGYRKGLIEQLLPQVSVELPAQGLLDPHTLFAEPVNSVQLEIGFGGGEHLSAQAEAHPNVGFIGVEPFVTGAARMLSEIDRKSLGNVRLLIDDARLLLRSLAPASIERVFVLFPDPWPKARHHKRRIVNPDTLNEISRILQPHGVLRMATDHVEYGRWMLRHALAEPALRWTAKSAPDWTVRPKDQPQTRYERKGLAAGRPAVFLEFVRAG